MPTSEMDGPCGMGFLLLLFEYDIKYLPNVTSFDTIAVNEVQKHVVFTRLSRHNGAKVLLNSPIKSETAAISRDVFLIVCRKN